MIDEDASARGGTSMRTWLYLGAGVLALMFMSLRDRIADDVPPAMEQRQQNDPGSARHATGEPAPDETTDVKLIGRSAQH